MNKKKNPQSGTGSGAENYGATKNLLQINSQHTSCQPAPLGNSAKNHDIQTHLIDGIDSTGKIHRVARYVLSAGKRGIDDSQ